MTDLTQRQIKILKHIIEEFIETAEPIGSDTLEKKYSLGISSATIRNEMSALTQLGYLKKGHSSAGRSPTSMALKYYIRNLMIAKTLSVAEEIGAKEKVWDYRNQFEKFIKETTKELANRTRSMAVATTEQGSFYTYGACHLLDEREFFNIDVTKTVLSLLDNPNYWFDILNKIDTENTETIIHLLIGEDLGMEHLDTCGFVYQTYIAGPHRGILGVMGPARSHYPRVVPLVNYFADLISGLTG